MHRLVLNIPLIIPDVRIVRAKKRPKRKIYYDPGARGRVVEGGGRDVRLQ